MGLMICILVVLFYLIPPISAIIIAYEKDCPKKLVYIISFGANLVLFLLAHKVILKGWNVFHTFQSICDRTITYQAVMFFPISLIAAFGMSVGIGMFIRIFMKKTSRVSLQRRDALILLAAVLSGGIIYSLYVTFSGIDNIVISEVDSEYDYVELYNKGGLSCNIHNLFLSDESNDLLKQAIPFEVLPSHGYMVVYIEKDAFSIRKDGGETIFLSEGSGEVVDYLTTIETKVGSASGRVSGAYDEVVLVKSSPKEPNEKAIDKLPVLSHESGFYDDSFSLSMEAPSGYSIYYTLDGSNPTGESILYKEPIKVYNRSAEPNVYRNIANVVKNWSSDGANIAPVDKAFVVRAALVDEEGVVGRSITATYFVGLDQYRDKAVVSIVGNPDDIWGDDGIYVTGAEYDAWYTGGQEGEEPIPNFMQRGKEYEVLASMEYFSEDLTFSQPVGLRISGQSSRNRNPKAFNLFSRKEYSGSGVFEEDIFEGVSSHKLGIRGGYANAIGQAITTDRNVATQDMIRVAVFLNGEFWYNSNIVEKYDATFFEEHYGVAEENVVIFNQGEITEGIPEDTEMYRDIHRYIENNDLSTAEGYTGFGQLVDIQSYIDYMCINVYMDNMDYTEIKNTIQWRSKEITGEPYTDGRWRFCLNDLDAMEWNDAYVWGLDKQAKKNSFALIPQYTGNVAINQQEMYVALKENELFRKQFVLSFMDMVNTNFKYDNVMHVIDEYGTDTENYHGGNGGTREIAYYEEFFRTRADYIVDYMAEEFGLTGSLENVKIQINDVEAGQVVVNTTTPDLSSGTWTGQYFTDYPVTVTAVANPGYEFVGWEGSACAKDATIEVSIERGGARLNAVFKKIN